MRLRLPIIFLSFAGLAAAAALAIDTPAAPALSVTVQGIRNQAPIPAQYALCKATDDGKSAPGENSRPSISWSGVPEGTKSLAVLITDPDVPADFTDAGKEGKTVAADAKRQLFYHWALADIPPDVTTIEGGDSEVAPLLGTRAIGSLGHYVKDAHNYGGPCPPWNDARVHHYHFAVYALAIPTLDLGEDATAADVAAAINGHVLASGEVVGTYSLNAAMKP
jgi:Raf kinase inhibitor-like YbhB/YbcL family protein